MNDRKLIAVAIRELLDSEKDPERFRRRLANLAEELEKTGEQTPLRAYSLWACTLVA